MKKIALLLTVASVGAISAMAQGNFVFQNSSTFPVKVATANTVAGLAAATVIGTANTVLTGPQTTISLFVAADGTALATLQAGTAVGTTLMSGSSAASFQGTFHGGNPFVLPAPFDGSGKIEYAFYGNGLNGQYTGWSALGTGYTPSTGVALPGATFGAGPGQIGGWTLTPSGTPPPVPEPTTLALGGLGAAALMFLRRRK